MYRNAYQRGILTVFFSVGSKPLSLWDTYIQDGYVNRFLDQDIKSMVFEIRGNNVSTTYMICPKGDTVLGISMPFLVMIVKNLKKYFTFEVTILDETNTRRRFRVSNFQSQTQIQPLCTVMPICLSEGWNQIQFNLADFTRRAYKKQFIEVQKLKINANIRLRRIYFTEKIIPEDELPAEYKLYFPIPTKILKSKKISSEEQDKENIKPKTPQLTDKDTEKRVSKSDSMLAISKGSLHTIKKSSSQNGKMSGTEKPAATIPEEVSEGKTNKVTPEEPVAEIYGDKTIAEDLRAEQHDIAATTEEQVTEPHDTEVTLSEPATTEPDTFDSSARDTGVEG